MFVLTVQPGSFRIPVVAGDTIDRALVASGFARPRRGCRRGGCGMCVVRLDAGATVDERPIADTALTDEQRAGHFVLPCRAMPTTDVEVTFVNGAVRCVSPVLRGLAEPRLAARGLPSPFPPSVQHPSQHTSNTP